MSERLDQYFSVFNNDTNDAANKANAEFIAQFGQSAYNEYIAPFHRKGIMSIFGREPTLHTLAWITLVTYFVNEGREEVE